MLKPLSNRVLIRQVEREEKTAGGIIIPESCQELPCEGEVIAHGEGRLTEAGNLIPMNVKVGDKVMYGKYAGTRAKVDGEELVILREEEIVGIIG